MPNKHPTEDFKTGDYLRYDMEGGDHEDWIAFLDRSFEYRPRLRAVCVSARHNPDREGNTADFGTHNKAWIADRLRIDETGDVVELGKAKHGSAFIIRHDIGIKSDMGVILLDGEEPRGLVLPMKELSPRLKVEVVRLVPHFSN